jgi:hypothetical protein
MKAPDVLITELMALVRRSLYAGKPDKTWFAQQQLVKKALLYPATWLKRREVEIPAERYKEIVEGIVATMVANGRLDGVSFMSRYLLTCVQRHMEAHGDEYYREGVNIRNRVTLVMDLVEKARAGADSTVPILAEADRLLKIGKRKAGALQRRSRPAAAPVEKAPRKVRSDALVYRLTHVQREMIANALATGSSYRKVVELCASWGIKTSLDGLTTYLKSAGKVANSN